MTLVVAIALNESALVVAADGMGYVEQGSAHVPYRDDKLAIVPATNWIVGFSGSVSMAGLRDAVHTKLKRKPEIDPALEIGSLEYIRLLKEQGHVNDTAVLLAGYTEDGRATVRISERFPETPHPSPVVYPFVIAIGAQRATALWIANFLLKPCTSLEDIKLLAYFVLHQFSDIKVGKPEAGFPIGMYSLAGKDQRPVALTLAERECMEKSIPTVANALQHAFKQSLVSLASLNCRVP